MENNSNKKVLFILLHFFAFGCCFMNGVEWNCTSTSNTGTFTRSTDCTIGGENHIEVSGTLAIDGSQTDMKHLITITAASKHRHFYLNNVNAKLILRYLKLVGGDVSSYNDDPGYDGGSICIYKNGGELNLYSSIVFNNKAKQGGGIFAEGDSSTNKNAIVNIYNSIIHNNEATNSGGGIYMLYAVGTIENTTIDYNQASYYGGGMYIWDSDVTMKNTIISNNDAGNKGGGLYIEGDSTTVTLRQSSFINNDATNQGDEICTWGSPTISLINTYFSNPNNNNNIYEDSGTPTWETCSDNLCTETSFTNRCEEVIPTDSKFGVLCSSTCSSNQFYYSKGIDAGCSSIIRTWDCALNEGPYSLNKHCIISGNNHVVVTNTLEINGTNTDMNNLITITAATNQRHFFLNDANAKLILRYLKLVGGDVSSYTSDPAQDGGSILIYQNGGELNLYSSIVFNNKAGYGGGIYAQSAGKTNKNAIMNIYNSIIHNNNVIGIGNGGGIYLYDNVVGTIYNTTIDNNQAYYGGGMVSKNSHVTMENTIISNNNARQDGGGLDITDGGTVILRQTTFISNAATVNGNAIRTSGGSPNILLINTYFNNPNNNNNIYVDTSKGSPTWKTCSDNLCTETPFTGSCNEVNNTNKKLGVGCSCSSSNTYVVLGKDATCKVYTNCGPGQYISTNGTSTTDRKCETCSNGQFSTNKNANNCTRMTTCDAGKYIATKGTPTTDRICKVCTKPGTGTENANSYKCNDCPIGKYNDNQVYPKGMCKPCAEGRHASLPKQKECIPCPAQPGYPPCGGKGDCNKKTGQCNCYDKGYGWTGPDCATCGIQWSKNNGQCNTCDIDYKSCKGKCYQCDINRGKFLSQQDCSCKLHTPLVLLDYIGYAAATLSACALIYKLYIFITLKRNGKLRKDLGFVKGFLAVIAYGGKGDHIIVSNDNSTMEENLLGEEERISDDVMEEDEDIMLEMPTVRESFSEILDTAELSEYKQKFAKYGIKSTKHLNDIVEKDLEELGLSGFQRRQFKKAVTKKAKKKGKEKTLNNDNNNNVADNNGNVATGNDNDNEGSKKIETMSKTKELNQDKKEKKLKK